jgi:hypothetical protein
LCGKAGHEWVMSDESKMSAESMCNIYIKQTSKVLENWEQPKRFNLFSIKQEIQKLKARKSGIMLSYDSN